ncbi:ribosome small subunit-dependent GTPase A [Tabrizicola sp. J26]|uniref:ribosome small subunit-dependent GTPase A n=1 Tax=Alitabrizicola rongguiensis TaxID=2909234 RepID=UPI001F3E59C4|nr:ribosome small subunit-dependent GTPase A [Tabrizicola rongguiensis]MCF1707632.1 ribosome small subunit-dependent GTPase A [Tabrizicola rongguiensis]
MTPHLLAGLGWSADFLRQLDLDEIGRCSPVRVATVHRTRLDLLGEAGNLTLPLPPGLPAGEVAVGDWLLLTPHGEAIHRLLDRRSHLSRKAAGTGVARQAIAANVDTLAIVTSCNAEFSESRLDRYLSLARAGGVAPLILLTKADLADPSPFRERAEATGRGVPVLVLDARDPLQAADVASFCGPGRTLALVGSSGVGKSTLAATLTGQTLATQAIREDDAKGRHTTTARHLMPTYGGGWLIDTPGMRELQLADAEAGIAATFDDIEAFARGCRFSDCAHDGEPGCAVAAAIASGELDKARLARWRKLMREDRLNTETIAQSRARARTFSRMVRHAMQKRHGRPWPD